MADFNETHWALLDLQYEYLDDGFKLTAFTDVPCHLYCRMTTTPPVKRVVPSPRRGIYLQGDVRFCFVVYEDNEQDEAGDTLTHTWLKAAWPICQTRWFYFVGTQGGAPSVSETAMFKFHFPAPPPEPPPPILRVFYAQGNNRTIQASAGSWSGAHNASSGWIIPNYDDPNYALFAGSYLWGGWHYIWRSFLQFDTLGMSPTARIVSAVLSPFPWTSNGTWAKFIGVTRGVQSDPVVPTDYGDQLPFTIVGGSKLNIPTGVYCDIELNADGLGWIYPGGLTRFCIRGQVDIYDESPAAVYNNYIWYYSLQRGFGFRPKLSIYYYPA